MSFAIRVEGLGKEYELGATHARSIRELVDASALRLLGRRKESRSAGSGAKREGHFWALREVSFDVKPGDAVGVIGRNGAGKSTLLKILSQITSPTIGRVEMRGRIASLLEVGTGFHPELTGRENVFLNGAILGMTRAEIRRKFDEIVAFAEVEEFIGTPVKRYSSGMYVRLAFAIAAHLEPEILVVDEVLAVGDVAFQRKCLRTMKDVSHLGRTVLFVSHNMSAIRTLCRTALWLDSGRVRDHGPSEQVVDRYLAAQPRAASPSGLAAQVAALPHDPAFRFLDVRVSQEGHSDAGVLGNGLPLSIEAEYEVAQRTFGMHVYFRLFDGEGALLFESLHNGADPEPPVCEPGRYVSTAVVPRDFLAAGVYELTLTAGIMGLRDFFPDPVRARLEIEATGLVNRAYPGYGTRGKIAPLLAWHTERLDDADAKPRKALAQGSRRTFR
jgi:lipopolysaccharide transport system ATP-binding protein